jgi:hypothetical protein
MIQREIEAMKNFQLPLPKETYAQLRAYAAKMTGTQIDLDSDLESAAIECLAKTARRTLPRRLQPNSWI